MLHQWLSLSSSNPLPIVALLINMLVGFGLSLLLRWHFIYYGSSLSQRRVLGNVFPVILLTTLLVIAVVKTSLALSLGMVGALSIVRFRTPVKEPEELAYIFLAMVMGLGLGADQRAATILGGIFIMVALAFLQRKRVSGSDNNLFLSLDFSSESLGPDVMDALHRLLVEHSPEVQLRRWETRERRVDAMYQIAGMNADKLSQLTAALQKNYLNINVTFIDQQHLPAL